MKSIHSLCGTVALACILMFSPMTSFANPATLTLASVNQKAEVDTAQLVNLWHNYQKQIQRMNQDLPKLKQTRDEEQKNLLVSNYNNQLEQIKIRLSSLLLVQNQAQQLRKQLIEHATKLQNVYKLATNDNMNGNQLNTWQRLNTQTEQLYQQIQNTVQTL